MKKLLTIAALGLAASSAFATDPSYTDVVTAASSAFTAVAAVAITITSFAVGLRLVKKFAK